MNLIQGAGFTAGSQAVADSSRFSRAFRMPVQSTPGDTVTFGKAATKRPGGFAKVLALAAALLAPPGLVSAHQLDHDYSVRVPGSQFLNAQATSELTRNLWLQEQIKLAQDDPSTLKLFLSNNFIGNHWPAMTGIADAFSLVNRPVDVIVQDNLVSYGLMGLQAATGKRFMSEDAYLQLGPFMAGSAGPVDEQLISAELSAEFMSILENTIMERTGVTDRAMLSRDLTRAKEWNALESLYFYPAAKAGLVDAILVGHDRVVTRDHLLDHFRRNNMNDGQIAEFLRNPLNVRELDSISLSEFSPESIPLDGGAGDFSGPKAFYVDPTAKDAKVDCKTEEEKKAEEEKTEKAEESGEPLEETEEVDKPDCKTPSENEDGAVIYRSGKLTGGTFTTKELADLPLWEKISASTMKGEARWSFDNLPEGSSWLTGQDVIFFNDAFTPKSAEEVTQSLLSLDQKRQMNPERDGHIFIMINSPGGNLISYNHIMQTIRQLRTPVSFIATGSAASAGAHSFASTPGVRVLTANARLMFHNPRGKTASRNLPDYMQSMENLVRMDEHMTYAIADRIGMPFDDLYRLMQNDTWLNPLEALFLGEKGAADVILADYGKGITRQDVYNYLADTRGGTDQADAYIQDRLRQLELRRSNLGPGHHNEADPFDNFDRTIREVAERYGKPLQEIEAMQNALATSGLSDHYVVVSE